MNKRMLTVNKLNLSGLPYKMLLQTGGIWMAFVVIQLISVLTGRSKSGVLLGMCYFLLLIIPTVATSVAGNIYDDR